VLIVSVKHAMATDPTGGWGTPQHYILPTIVYSLHTMALVARYTRVNMLESLRGDYVRTARAKGLTERTIIRPPRLKKRAHPLITVLGPRSPTCDGLHLIEAVFRIPVSGDTSTRSAWNRTTP